jgi:hypothetical protein
MMLIVCIIMLMLAIPAEASSPKKTVKSPSSDVCEYVVSYANRGQLKQIFIPSVPDASSSVRMPDSISSGVVFKRLIDINYDGKKEVVVSLELSSGSGRGCDGTFLGVLTADRTAIDKKMTEKLPAGDCGGQAVTPFFVDGKTYLDERQQDPHAEHRQIYMLYGDKLKTICKFEVRPVNYVLSIPELHE